MKMVTAIMFATIGVFFISCDRGTSSDTATENQTDESERFTITHMADDSEDVFITLSGSSQMELSPGECVSLSRKDFSHLGVKAGAGYRSDEFFNVFKQWGDVELCGGNASACVPGNYAIKDKGRMTDDYQLIPVEEPNPDCPKTLK